MNHFPCDWQGVEDINFNKTDFAYARLLCQSNSWASESAESGETETFNECDKRDNALPI